jgi:hypothetical protein
MDNFKFANAKQAQKIYAYKNTTQKLLKMNIANQFNNVSLLHH